MTAPVVISIVTEEGTRSMRMGLLASQENMSTQSNTDSILIDLTLNKNAPNIVTTNNTNIYGNKCKFLQPVFFCDFVAFGGNFKTDRSS